MTMIAANLHQVRTRIVTACTAADRDPAGVQLLAVSKTFPAEAVREALAAGQTAFGENYVQEGVAKIEALADVRSQLVWHCIGPLQSNKTRVVAEHFDWVHSIDRLKIAERLSEQRPDAMPPRARQRREAGPRRQDDPRTASRRLRAEPACRDRTRRARHSIGFMIKTDVARFKFVVAHFT